MKKKLFAGVIGLVLVLIQWVGSGTAMAASRPVSMIGQACLER